MHFIATDQALVASCRPGRRTPVFPANPAEFQSQWSLQAEDCGDLKAGGQPRSVAAKRDR